MNNLQLDLRKLAKPEKIPIYKNFFKTGTGEYGEGDEFIGVTVPDTRKIAMKYIDVSYNDLIPILKSKVHEDRMCALINIVYKFQKAKSEKEKEIAVNFYIKYHLSGNNWDLVDCVSDKILGPWLIDKDKSILYKYAKSSNLWERRISIITTYHFIKNNKFEDALKISEILINDKHDLIHKAVGWMLREMGKRDLKVEEDFLKKNYKKMPRTMLRYAIEKFPDKKRKAYLIGEI